MTNSVKINKAVKIANLTQYSETANALIDALKATGLDLSKLTAKQIAQILTGLNNQYHAGRTSAGAELIDGTAVWVGGNYQKMIELN